MAITINTAFQNALLDRTLRNPSAITSGLFDGGVLELYQGVQPADANGVANGADLLATMTLPASNAFAAAAAGSAALSSAITEAAAPQGGTASWCRLRDSADSYRLDGDVRATADPDAGEFLVLDNKTIVQNGVVTVTSMTLSHPA